MVRDDDTIAAIATAPGRGAIGIVRISGPAVPTMMPKLVGASLRPRSVSLVSFTGSDGKPVDQGIAFYFAAPASYTGQPVLELQGHGGPVVQRMLLQRCVDLGARPAEPGEFTRRAFLNGKLDLAQAEAVADVIDASTTAAARGAMRSLTGAFSARIQELVAQLIELRALVEGTIDFPEEDIDFLAAADAAGRLARIRATLAAVWRASREGSLLREGARVVLIGRPNVGKSSLLNRLAGDDVAIVTDIPGTTRDVIRQAIDLSGIPAYIIDTAGLRESADPVEQAGMARTWAAAEGADVVLLVVDARVGVTAEDAAILARLPADMPRILVHNKVDLVGGTPARAMEGEATGVWVSAKLGEGVELLRSALLEAVGWHGRDEAVFVARARHLSALQIAGTHLEAAAGATVQLELYAEELRLAQEALGRITGEFSADDLLGEIFSRFCIGK
ncbi:MAG: tRNA uridine-5-carboxymethylaminomethyl(34) synthesis GTPase MnmE [Rhodospirillaceae bacterium]